MIVFKLGKTSALFLLCWEFQLHKICPCWFEFVSVNCTLYGVLVLCWWHCQYNFNACETRWMFLFLIPRYVSTCWLVPIQVLSSWIITKQFNGTAALRQFRSEMKDNGVFIPRQTFFSITLTQIFPFLLLCTFTSFIVLFVVNKVFIMCSLWMFVKKGILMLLKGP